MSSDDMAMQFAKSKQILQTKDLVSSTNKLQGGSK